MKNAIKTLSIGLASIAFVSNVIAQEARSSAAYEKDAKILSDVMAMNSYNIHLMKIIEQKSQNAELKQNSSQMLPFYLALDGQLTAFANKQTLNIESEKKEKIAEKVAKWDAKKPGAEWERDMAEELVDVNKDGVDMLQDAQTKVESPELKKMIDLALQKIPANLDALTLIKEKTKKAAPVTAPAAAPVQSTGVADEMSVGVAKDAKIVSDMVNLNMYAAKLSELALKKGQHRDLKDEAQKLLEDNNMMLEVIKSYATAKTYGLDADEVTKTNEKLKKWEVKNGGMEWDADISEELKDVHKDGIDMLQNAKEDAKDPELIKIINSELPILKEHLIVLTPMKDVVKKVYQKK